MAEDLNSGLVVTAGLEHRTAGLRVGPPAEHSATLPFEKRQRSLYVDVDEQDPNWGVRAVKGVRVVKPSTNIRETIVGERERRESRTEWFWRRVGCFSYPVCPQVGCDGHPAFLYGACDWSEFSPGIGVCVERNSPLPGRGGVSVLGIVCRLDVYYNMIIAWFFCHLHLK